MPLEDLERVAFDKCIPLHVTLELTLRCNLRCVHCYNFDREGPYPARGPELSEEEILRIVGEVRAAGCLFLVLTGGEPLAHPHLDKFVRHAHELGMMVTIKSNGTLLDRAMAGRLAGAHAAGVDISLYGAGSAVHDAFVKQPGAFALTIAGVRAARAAGLRVKLSLVLVRHNADEIEAMLELAAALDVPWQLDPQITARYDGSRSSLDLRIDRETLERLYRGPLRAAIPRAGGTGIPSVQCGCARSVCGVSATGEVYPCIGAPLPSGNLRRESFATIWKDSPELAWIRGLSLADFPACKGCDHRDHCRRTSGTIYNNTGRYTGPERFGDDWTCIEAEVLHRIREEEAALVKP